VHLHLIMDTVSVGQLTWQAHCPATLQSAPTFPDMPASAYQCQKAIGPPFCWLAAGRALLAHHTVMLSHAFLRMRSKLYTYDQLLHPRCRVSLPLGQHVSCRCHLLRQLVRHVLQDSVHKISLLLLQSR
jgi:hypothetical protein